MRKINDNCVQIQCVGNMSGNSNSPLHSISDNHASFGELLIAQTQQLKAEQMLDKIGEDMSEQDLYNTGCMPYGGAFVTKTGQEDVFMSEQDLYNTGCMPYGGAFVIKTGQEDEFMSEQDAMEIYESERQHIAAALMMSPISQMFQIQPAGQAPSVMQAIERNGQSDEKPVTSQIFEHNDMEIWAFEVENLQKATESCLTKRAADMTDSSTAAEDGDSDRWQALSVNYAAADSERAIFDVEHIPIKVGDGVVTQEQEVNSQIASTVNNALEDGKYLIELELTPSSLGTVQVKLNFKHDGSVQVLLRTSTQQAENILKKNIGELTSVLSGNVQGTIDIEVEPASQMEQIWYQSGQGNSQKQGNDNHQQQHPQQRKKEDFFQRLRLGLDILGEAAS